MFDLRKRYAIKVWLNISTVCNTRICVTTILPHWAQLRISGPHIRVAGRAFPSHSSCCFFLALATLPFPHRRAVRGGGETGAQHEAVGKPVRTFLSPPLRFAHLHRPRSISSFLRNPSPSLFFFCICNGCSCRPHIRTQNYSAGMLYIRMVQRRSLVTSMC